MQKKKVKVPASGEHEIIQLRGKRVQVRSLPAYRSEQDRPIIERPNGSQLDLQYGRVLHPSQSGFDRLVLRGTDAADGDLITLAVYEEGEEIDSLPERILPGLGRVGYRATKTLGSGEAKEFVIVPSSRSETLRVIKFALKVDASSLTASKSLDISVQLESDIAGTTAFYGVGGTFLVVQAGDPQTSHSLNIREILPPGYRGRVNLAAQGPGGFGSMDVRLTFMCLSASNQYLPPK
jgi:hypothetical protein